MKLHITYNFSDMAQAIKIAGQTAEFADILGVGSLLLLKEGVKAVKTFKASFPNKEIFVEAKICEKGDESITMLAQAGANYISILAGAYHNTIKKAINAAKNYDVKIALDLLDAPSIGQSAMDAKTLGAHMLILHRPASEDELAELESEWENVRENTNLPIFITGKINQENISTLLDLRPQGIMIGAAITKADSPAKSAHYFKSLM